MSSELVDALRSGSKIVVVHSNADPDALGSAFAIASCFPPADIHAPEGLDRSGKALQQALGIELVEDCDLSRYDRVVLVDTSSPEQVLPVGEIPPGSVVIDHHLPNGRWEGMMFHCDEGKASCAEVVADILDEAGMTLPRDAALAMMVGMLTDSGHFQHGNPALMRRFASMMEGHSIAVDEVMAGTRAETGISERVAVLKGLQRSRFDRVGEHVVAVAYGSTYEASICRALLNSGADVAFVGSQRDERFRVSARCSQKMVRKGLHLGRSLDELGGETLSEGGGHGGAAGMTGEGDVEAVLHMCMSKAMDLFREMRDSAPQGL